MTAPAEIRQLAAALYNLEWEADLYATPHNDVTSTYEGRARRLLGSEWMQSVNTRAAEESTKHPRRTVSSARQSLNLAEASAVLGIPIATAYRLVDEGTYPVPVRKAGRRWVIPVHPLAEFLHTDEAAVIEAASLRHD